MTTTTKFVSGFAAGALLGVTVGLLFSPKKGKKMRAMISDQAKDMANSVGDTYQHTKQLFGLKQKEKATV